MTFINNEVRKALYIQICLSALMYISQTHYQLGTQVTNIKFKYKCQVQQPCITPYLYS